MQDLMLSRRSGRMSDYRRANLLESRFSRENIMAIRIKMRNGSEVLVQATMTQWQEALKTATQRQQLLEIEQPDGTVAPVNPLEIESFREEPDAAQALEQRFEAAAG